MSAHRAGYVAVVGRPNVGKSTLVNRMVGQKVAIVSDKPQTTRNRILAVVHRPQAQLVLFDTPGIHKPMHRMNERMVEAALRAVGQVEVVLWVADVTEAVGSGDRFVAERLRGAGKPVVLGLNKIDRVKKPLLLPAIDRWQRVLDFHALVPFSARTGENVDELETVLIAALPESPPLYPDDFLTDQAERFLAAETVREKVLHLTREEVPYSVGVMVESFREDPDLTRIEATILVERPGQKAILLGKEGGMIKAVGTAARLEIESWLGTRVYLGLFVKVRERWREDPEILAHMGLGD